MMTTSRVRRACLALAALTLAGCDSIYGANFEYPREPDVPRSVDVLAKDKGSDDDDPIRSRIAVIDTGETSLAALIEFYRSHYSSDDGWGEFKASRSIEELCLARRPSDDYAEFLEILPYRDSRIVARPGRYLVVLSRIQTLRGGSEEKTCGQTAAWIPYNLLRNG